MRFPIRLLAAALAALPLLAPHAGAQTPTLLRDADVARIMPVIAAYRGETDRRNDAVSGMLGDVATAERFARDARAGRIDLREVMKEHSRHVVVPAGATYEAACSNAMMIPGSSGGVRGSLALAWRLPAGTSAAEVVAFYEGEGFRVDSRAPGTTHLEWPDQATDSVYASVGRVFRRDAVTTECRHLDGIDVVVLGLKSFGFAAGSKAAQPGVSNAVAGREAALRGAGLTDAQFQDLLGAAMMARADAGPEMRENLDKLMAIPEMRPSLEARKKNAAWYLRNRSSLEPRLGEFLESLGR